MEGFGDRLIGWYNRNKRDLPWRDTLDPYKIWLSEIILQQTRVDQGLDYYIRFVEKYPDVFKLAAAPQEEVFKLWQGLGYYNRAANMISAAKTIVEEHHGKFPVNHEKLLKLKGIGAYTSAAIASIAFAEAVPVVDGNVYRVLSRIFGIKTPVNLTSAKAEFTSKAKNLMAEHPPGTFNQALMEFGALYCKPQNPACAQCIFSSECYAFQNEQQQLLPVKKNRAKVVNRYFYYLVIEFSDKSSDYIYLKKRENKDIWRNLYDFPMVETKVRISLKKDVSKFVFEHFPGLKGCVIHSFSNELTHLLTHRKIHARFIHLSVNKKLNMSMDKSLLLINKNEFERYPVPRLIDRYLQEQRIIN